MSALLGRRLWNSLRKVLLIIAVIVILAVAWEAVVVAFPVLAEYSVIAYLGAMGPVVLSAATWAAASPWLFALASIVVVSMVDPEFAKRTVRKVGEVLVEVVDTLADVAKDVAKAVIPTWLWYLGAAWIGMKFLGERSGSTQSSGS